MAKKKRPGGNPAARDPEVDRIQQERLQAQAAQLPQQLQRAHEAGFGAGFAQGYTKALEDLFAEDTIVRAGTGLFAEHRSPIDQTRYVLSRATVVLRPQSPEDLREGLRKALRAHYRRIQTYATPGIMMPEEPEFRDIPEAPPPGWERVRG